MNQRLAPNEMLRALNLGMYDEAKKRGLTFSEMLERETVQPEKADGLDAFQRLLSVAGIKTRTHPEGQYMASEVQAFRENDNATALFPEWVRRVVRKVRFRPSGPQAATDGRSVVFLSDDTAPGGVMRPYADLLTPRETDRTGPAIPLNEVVAATRFVDGAKARSYYLNRDAVASRRKRVAEAAAIPPSVLTTKEHDIDLPKYAIRIDASYEAVRRLPLDQFERFLMQEAIQAEVDKVAAALDVMVNGDGNTSTAGTVYALTTLDSTATVGTLSLKAWLAFKALFANPYGLDHVLGTQAVILQLLLLNIGSSNVPLQTRQDLGGFRPINQTFADGVAWGITADAPASKIVGYDREWAIGRVVENGSQIQEVARWITNQTNILTASENEGFETLDPNAIKILNLAA